VGTLAAFGAGPSEVVMGDDAATIEQLRAELVLHHAGRDG
jgi:hypothetical protein